MPCDAMRAMRAMRYDAMLCTSLRCAMLCYAMLGWAGLPGYHCDVMIPASLSEGPAEGLMQAILESTVADAAITSAGRGVVLYMVL